MPVGVMFLLMILFLLISLPLPTFQINACVYQKSCYSSY
ncbi:putative membrane protein [Synechococcus sp. MIT S9220]|nr:putative membrane protein [Synechococcus sp. MIT S9220]